MEQVSPTMKPSPNTLLHFDVEEFIAIAVRMAEILNDETELLAQMNVRGMAELHHEKLKLTQMLESYQSLLRARPDIIEEVPDETRERLVSVVTGFGKIMEHNFRHVAAARSVNQTVVKAITDSIAEQQHLTVYTKSGGQFRAGAEMSGVSINLNQQA
ncbi:MAG: hypothetical protein ACOYJ2_00550 [Rickettsiales bacterium]